MRRDLWDYSTGRFLGDDLGKKLSDIIRTQLLMVGYVQDICLAVGSLRFRPFLGLLMVMSIRPCTTTGGF